MFFYNRYKTMIFISKFVISFRWMHWWGSESLAIVPTLGFYARPLRLPPLGALKSWHVFPTGALYTRSTGEKTMIFSDPPAALNPWRVFPKKDFNPIYYRFEWKKKNENCCYIAIFKYSNFIFTINE